MRAKKPLTSTSAAVPTAPATLADKRAEWLKCLHGDDDNSIRRQLENLLWDLLSWSTINDARRWAPHDETGKVKGFALLHGLLDRCFATTVMVGVRRLCDAAYTIDDPKRGVWSIASLLTDMQKHAELFRRDDMLQAEGIALALPAVQGQGFQALRKSVTRNVAGLRDGTLGSSVYEESWCQRRHDQIDVLVGVATANRSGRDSVPPDFFEKLKTKLSKECKTLNEKVNKFIAHAAPPHSRFQLVDDSSQVTPASLFSAVFAIKKAFDFISEIVLGKGWPLVPAAEVVDNLENIECPLVNKERIPEVRCAWDKTKVRLSASYGDDRAYLKEVGMPT